MSASAAAAPPSSVRSTLAAAGVGIGRLNHIALAVPDLDKAVALYRDVLGANVSAPEVPQCWNVSGELLVHPDSQQHYCITCNFFFRSTSPSTA